MVRPMLPHIGRELLTVLFVIPLLAVVLSYCSWKAGIADHPIGVSAAVKLEWDVDEAIATLAWMGAMANGGEVRRGEAAWVNPQPMSSGHVPWPSTKRSVTLKAMSAKAVATLDEAVAADHLHPHVREVAHMHLADLLRYGKGVKQEPEIAFGIYGAVASRMETQVGECRLSTPLPT